MRTSTTTSFSDIMPITETRKAHVLGGQFLWGLDILGIKDYGLVGVSLSGNKWDRMCSITATVHPFPSACRALVLGNIDV